MVTDARNRYSMQMERDICRCTCSETDTVCKLRGTYADAEVQKHMGRDRGTCRGTEADAEGQRQKQRHRTRAETCTEPSLKIYRAELEFCRCGISAETNSKTKNKTTK